MLVANTICTFFRSSLFQRLKNSICPKEIQNQKKNFLFCCWLKFFNFPTAQFQNEQNKFTEKIESFFFSCQTEGHEKP